MTEIIICIGLISISVYLMILIYIFVGTLRHDIEYTKDKPYVSVIITAHNESRDIASCLDAICQQSYPAKKLEIIIVNDRSTDNTRDIIRLYQKQNTQIKVISIEETQQKSPKKFALDKGISTTQGEIILTTDADCIPPIHWVSKVVSCFTPETGMIVGFAPLHRTSWWLSPLMCIDALVAGLTAQATLGWGHAVTCAGRNMAYRKRVFIEAGGFSGIEHILTGDDDLFMQKVAQQTDWKIGFIADPLSAVYSTAPVRWSHFLSQRKRHISGSKYFPRIIQVGYVSYFVSKMYIVSLFIICILIGTGYYFSLTLLLFFLLPTMIMLSWFSYKTGQIHLLIYYPLWEIYYLVTNLFLAPFALTGHINWGERHAA